MKRFKQVLESKKELVWPEIENNLNFLEEQPARSYLKSFINFVITRTH